MATAEIGKGLCLGIGGTNARVSFCENKEVCDFRVEPTPVDTQAFFQWMAEEIITAAEQGATWAVVGVPGLAKETTHGHSIGPLANVPGLSKKSYMLEEELAKANPKITTLRKQGFAITVVNDGLLSAFAAADTFGEHEGKKYNAIAYFIMGTGVGGAIVRRQKDDTFRPSESLMEIGHVPLQHDLEETFETALSGTGLERKHGRKAEHLDAEHAAWQEVGRYLGQMVMILGLVGGADLVVMGSGVGSNAYEFYYPYLEEYLEKFRKSSNTVHQLTVPAVVAVPPKDAQKFEMHGAEGVIRHYLSNRAA